MSRGITASRRRAAALGACLWFSAAGLFGTSCIANRPDKCSVNSDCESGFCDGQGFCKSECTTNRDCPCGSHCASSCGICVRDAGDGPATCFPLKNGLSNEDVSAACRPESVAESAASSSSGAAGAEPQPVDTRDCPMSVEFDPKCTPPAPGSGGSVATGGQPSTGGSVSQAGAGGMNAAGAGTAGGAGASGAGS